MEPELYMRVAGCQGKRNIDVSPGESVRIIRELQELSQNEPAVTSEIPQSTISVIARDRITLGVERAKQLGRALRCHRAVLVFPGMWSRNRQPNMSMQRIRPRLVGRGRSALIDACNRRQRGTYE
jgi:hypothetical protein